MPGRTAVAFTPDGKQIVTGSWSGTARVWDARSGRETLVLPANDAIFAVAVSPDGKRIALGCYDSTARVWDTRSGAEVSRLRGHSEEVISAVFSPDGRFVSTGSAAAKLDRKFLVMLVGGGCEVG